MGSKSLTPYSVPMKMFFFLTVYNLLYPLFLFFALPGYLFKMYRRGGYGTGLLERFGVYRRTEEAEPRGGIYIHAVSVGETLIAMKWIRAWMKTHNTPVILAVSTSTGHAVAREQAADGVRVLYSPLDLPGLADRCMARFEPKALVLVEAELWPNMGMAAHKRNIPVVMINARLSARSEKRYKKVLPVTRLLFSFLDYVGVQDAQDAVRFEGIGISPSRIVVTGSIKFDGRDVPAPQKRPEFARLLERLSGGKPVILAASTHAGEEVAIAAAIREAEGFPLIVPRHAERRASIRRELTADGWIPVLRTDGESSLPVHAADNICYIADTTGELRDWTAHADIAVIGKSFLAEGGQNPAEAVSADVPVVTGPHMENFQALVDMLEKAGGITRCELPGLANSLRKLLSHSSSACAQASRAHSALADHDGATIRTVDLVDRAISEITGKQ